jgi:hypothetical protein
MADINLSQQEADKLMAMEKKGVDQRRWTFPGPAARIVVPLTSFDKRENFALDVTRYPDQINEGHVSKSGTGGHHPLPAGH